MIQGLKLKNQKAKHTVFAIVTVIFYTVAFSCFSDASIAKGTEINASVPLGGTKGGGQCSNIT